MRRPNGALRILLYNWPIYLAACALGLGWVLVAVLEPRFGRAAAFGGIPVAWSVASLLVSHYIYDRSALLGGRWLPALLSAPTRTWATVHAGLDAEVKLDSVMPGRCLAHLDVFDRSVMTSASIRRARRRTPPANTAIPCAPTALELPDQGCDAIVVAFTAHEIRDRLARERFFSELHRCLRGGGRVVLVEHLQDFFNFLAFGPGCLHFQSRREWLRLAADARLTVVAETRITPWVMALSLERAP